MARRASMRPPESIGWAIRRSSLGSDNVRRIRSQTDVEIRESIVRRAAIQAARDSAAPATKTGSKATDR
jgi:hypothetical protein